MSCRVLGLCLLQNEMCPLFFNRHVLKYLLGRAINWHDLAFYDPVMYESLRTLIHDAETSRDAAAMFTALDLTFSIELPAEEVRCLVPLDAFYLVAEKYHPN